ncbi:MAG: NADH-quinone oxidoreductase subunit NuoE [Candidatus Brocadiia bacterium]
MNPTTVSKKLPREMLIPLLQEAQERDGFLSRESITAIAEKLSVPMAKVYGVASFYNQFTFVKPGKIVVRVCRGTACHVKGSERILSAFQAELKLTPGQTTKDGLFTLEVVACLGACGLAPVVMIDGEFHGRMTNKDVPRIIAEYRKREKGASNG